MPKLNKRKSMELDKEILAILEKKSKKTCYRLAQDFGLTSSAVLQRKKTMGKDRP